MARWVRLEDAYYYVFGNGSPFLDEHEAEFYMRKFSELFISYKPDAKETVLPKELDGEKEQVFKTEDLGGWHLMPQSASKQDEGNSDFLSLIAHSKTKTGIHLKGEIGILEAISALNKLALDGYSCKKIGATATNTSCEILYEENGNFIICGILPIVSLSKDTFVDIENEYYNGSSPERALKIAEKSGF